MDENKHNSIGVYRTTVADIDFADVIRQSRHPIIDLAPLRSMLSNPKDKIRFYKVLLHPFLAVTQVEQDRFIFVGEPELVRALLEAEPDIAPVLMRNPSVAKILAMPTSH